MNAIPDASVSMCVSFCRIGHAIHFVELPCIMFSVIHSQHRLLVQFLLLFVVNVDDFTCTVSF